METKLLRYTLRVDRLLFQKFRYIAESEGRSANKEIEQYLKKRVAEYEKRVWIHRDQSVTKLFFTANAKKHLFEVLFLIPSL